ncbi:UNKNOWN [Stylonychia lemnae]|uniref:Dolichol phosphate-mannose biosynthesis regulatory protein n=1 Tax=Stylonychia lemnae TaxID=5949 RepID=A0A078AUF6_STYLE|nr:UNKNOWN [Stylonychia lemnae]|eukprot:CDW85646.1 UNKNOWN [Stylonychia lemnae]
MGAFDKVFGLALILAGVTIAVYYTLWVIHSIPCVCKHFGDLPVFLDPVWLFILPSMALIGGVSFIWFFISSTNKKIALAKAQAAAKVAQEKKGM